MKIKILTLCDFAADYNGRLSIIGTTDRLTSEHYPSAPVSFSIVCQFELTPSTRVGMHPVSLVFFDKETGEHIMKEQQLNLSVSEVGSDVNNRRLLANLIVKVDSLSFPTPGVYIVKVTTEDDAGDIELYVD